MKRFTLIITAALLSLAGCMKTTKLIEVEPANHPPVIVSFRSEAYSAYMNRIIVIAQDPDGDALQYEWNAFGNGRLNASNDIEVPGNVNYYQATTATGTGGIEVWVRDREYVVWGSLLFSNATMTITDTLTMPVNTNPR